MRGKKVEIDWGKLNAILQFYPTKTTCADILNCSEDTLDKNIQEHHGMNFKEYREKKMGNTRVQLAKKAVDMALNGNVTMLIFCLKNLCGWNDQQFQNMSTKQQVIELKYRIDEPEAK